MVLNIDRFYSLWCHHISGNTLLTFVKSKLLCSILKHICKKIMNILNKKPFVAHWVGFGWWANSICFALLVIFIFWRKSEGIVCFYEVKCVMANVYRADIEQKRGVYKKHPSVILNLCVPLQYRRLQICVQPL